MRMIAGRMTAPVVTCCAVLAACLVLPVLAPTAQASPDTAWVERTLAAMTTRQKVGQLFVPRVYGTSADTRNPAAIRRNRAELGVANAVELVADYGIGGVVYFSANVTTPRALARFGNSLQQAAAQLPVPIAVLTAMDQEQGTVVRVGPPATVLPGNMALGASRSLPAARESARITAVELRAMGVRMDYAPVADVNTNPANPVIGVRSFSSDPVLAAQLTGASIDGLHAGGVAATAKHFPGHGDTSVDSHRGLPVIDHDRAGLDAVDLAPFRAAIAAGVDAIMTGHLVVPALDPSGSPATLSEPVITGVLRRQLGFDGVVVTDSLRMAGVRRQHADGEVAVRAILAGADQLLDPPDLPAAFAAVLRAVGSGRISAARLDASVRRILALKADLGLTSPELAMVDTSAVRAVVGGAAHRDAALRITDLTTTVIAGDGGTALPDVRGSRILITGPSSAAMSALARILGQRGAQVSVLQTGARPSPAAIDRAVRAARGADHVIALTWDVRSGDRQARLIHALQDCRTPLHQVAIGTPYDISAFPDVTDALATYSALPIAMRSLARVLLGEVRPVGRLPVAVPGQGGRILFPVGWRAMP
ncbi:MAG: glycoside hydrolase family 3 protein [Actinomycetales bacterium]|nr:glycoside hydrolase family 3 protein [Actinomycetales bacterium]